jgi:hypothetical protein
MEDKDPIERKIRDGRIDRFHCIAVRGTVIRSDQEFTTTFTPLSLMQARVCFEVYRTIERNANYCDDPGMMFLGKLSIELPSSGHLDKLLFGFSFGQIEMSVTVRNKTSGQYYKTIFDIAE